MSFSFIANMGMQDPIIQEIMKTVEGQKICITYFDLYDFTQEQQGQIKTDDLIKIIKLNYNDNDVPFIIEKLMQINLVQQVDGLHYFISRNKYIEGADYYLVNDN